MTDVRENPQHSADSRRQRVRIGENVHCVDWLSRTIAGQAILADAHLSSERPSCLCVSSAVPMYVAKRGQRYYLARMPGSGPLHAPHCNSLETANWLSGMDCYADGVLDYQSDGSVLVRFNAAMEPGTNLPACGMNGLLDLMIEGASLNVFATGSELRVRSSDALQRLRDAAATIRLVDRGLLSGLLLVPAPFEKDRQDEQNAQYLRFLGDIPLPYACSMIRTLQPSEFGWLLRLKHLPRIKFWLSKAMGDALFGRGAGTLTPENVEGSLCLIQAKQGRTNDSFSIKSIGIRMVDSRKMPILAEEEMSAADGLAADGKGFMRPLRFDAPWSRVLADYLVAVEACEIPLMFVMAPTGCPEYDEAKKRAAGPLIRGGAALGRYARDR